MALGFELPRLTFLVGLDRQSIDPDLYPLGRAHWSNYGYSTTVRLSSYIADQDDPWFNLRPMVFTSAPYTTDNAGESFPSGTVFVVMAVGRGIGGGIVRQPGVTTQPLTIGFPYLRAGFLAHVVYTVSGAVPGSTCNVKIKNGATELSSLTVDGDDGENQTLLMSSFTPTQDDCDNAGLTVDWSGGVPRFESVSMLPWCAGDFYAVPDTLPDGYTARNETDINRGGTFMLRRGQSSINQLRGSNHTYETLGLITRDSQAGIPAIDTLDMSFAEGGQGNYNVWIGQTLKRYDWLPIAINREGVNAGASLLNWPDDVIEIPNPVPPYIPPTIIIHTRPAQPAYREGSATILRARALTLVWGAGDTLGNNITVRAYQDTGLIYTRVFTAAECSAGGSESLTGAFTNPALGTPTTFSTQVDTVGGDYYEGDTIAFDLFVSPACDIPFPFSVATRQDDGSIAVAPGGYLEDSLADPLIDPLLVKLASGVTSNAAGAPIRFLPEENEWKQVTVASVASLGCGESSFDHDQAKSIDRAHAGRPFYALADGLPSDTCAIAAYTPTNTSIASGGTTVTLDVGNWWRWAKADLPDAGRYRINARPVTVDQVRRGLTVGWSLTDLTVLDPVGRRQWNSVSNPAGAYVATQATPPGSPIIDRTYIVATSPTGAWAGITPGTVVAWDAVANGWRQYVPVAGLYLINLAGTDWVWYNGSAWMASTDPVISFVVDVTEATTLGIVLGALSSDRVASGAACQARVSWAAE